MVKRQKGRRQILQLNDKSPSSPIIATSSKVLPRLLTHYSDSDEESDKSQDPDTSISSISENVSKKTDEPINLQVADFLKEIDALTTDDSKEPEMSEDQPKGPVDEKKPKTKKTDISNQPTVDSSQIEITSQPSGSIAPSQNLQNSSEYYCLWQQCQDESTGYVYYWNVQTNEVTWDCPPEYLNYLKYLNASASVPAAPQPSQPPQPAKNNGVKMVKKSDAIVKEGAIIPISYFGDTTSSEDSSDEESNVKSSTVIPPKPAVAKTPIPGKKILKKDIKKLPTKVTRKSKSSVIGPELPPDFQFPAELSPASPTQNYDSNPVGIGPQLPPGYVPSIGDKEDIVSEEKPKDVAKLVKEDSWEDSLAMLEQQYCSMQKEQTSVGPDSTTARSLILNENASLGTVADYGSTTDEDDEIETSLITSQEPPPPTVEKVEDSTTKNTNSSIEIKPLFPIPIENCPSTKAIVSSKTLQSTPKVDSLQDTEDELQISETSQLPKQVSGNKNNSPSSSSSSTIKLKNSDKSNEENSQKCPYGEIIDNIFSLSHTSIAKFGLGFSKNEELEIEQQSSLFPSYKKKRSNVDGAPISFVKSDSVLDLNTLNPQTDSDCLNDMPSLSQVPKKRKHDNNSEFPEKVKQLKVSDIDLKNTDVDSNVISETKLKDSTSKNPEEVKEGTDNLLEKLETPEAEKKLISIEDSSILDDPLECNIDDIDEILNKVLKEKQKADRLKALELEEAKKKILVVKEKSSIDGVPKPLTKAKTEASSVSAEDSIKNTCDIIDTSNVIMDKLTFLMANNSNMASLSTYLVQIQTRLMDWQAGVLDSKYFMDRLKELQQYLRHYERESVDGDWTCQWDRDNKRYFYMNGLTQNCQWTFPSDFPKSSAVTTWNTSLGCAPSTSTATFQSSGVQFALVSSSISEEQHHLKKTTPVVLQKEMEPQKNENTMPNWLLKSVHSVPSPPPPPPGVDSPPPPPPDSPPPPPPDSMEKEGEINDVDMDIDSDSSDSPPTFTIVHSTSSQLHYKPFFEYSPRGSPDPYRMATSNVSSTSSTSAKPVFIMKPPQPSISEPIASSNLNTSVSPPKSSGVAAIISDDKTPSLASSLTAPVIVQQPSSDEAVQPAASKSVSSTNSTASTSGKKEKKKAKKILSGLAFKKKNIPSLVQKWQKIKEEQDKDSG